jgi:GH18 family chitinase
MNMDVGNIDSSKYTHIHFAFAVLTEDYQVSLGELTGSFNSFKVQIGYKRIIDFGGWTFSTDSGTYHFFRNGISAENRQTMATNIANFVNDHGLDGVVLDIEYPSAPDVPGIPPGSPQEGPDYLAFFKSSEACYPTSQFQLLLLRRTGILKDFLLQRSRRWWTISST